LRDVQECVIVSRETTAGLGQCFGLLSKLRFVSRETNRHDVPTVDMTKDSFCPILTGFGNTICVLSLPSTVCVKLVDKPDLPINNANADAVFVSVRQVRTAWTFRTPDVTEMRIRFASISLRDVSVAATVDVTKGHRTPSGEVALASKARQPDRESPDGIA
jgi:hypothetical protein